MKKVILTLCFLGLFVHPASAQCGCCPQVSQTDPYLETCSLNPITNNYYARGTQVLRCDSEKYSITGAAVQVDACECPENYPVAYELCPGHCSLQAPVFYEVKENKSWTRHFW